MALVLGGASWLGTVRTSEASTSGITSFALCDSQCEAGRVSSFVPSTASYFEALYGFRGPAAGVWLMLVPFDNMSLGGHLIGT